MFWGEYLVIREKGIDCFSLNLGSVGSLLVGTYSTGEIDC